MMAHTWERNREHWRIKMGQEKLEGCRPLLNQKHGAANNSSRCSVDEKQQTAVRIEEKSPSASFVPLISGIIPRFSVTLASLLNKTNYRECSASPPDPQLAFFSEGARFQRSRCKNKRKNCRGAGACSKFPPLQIRWNSAGSLREAWRMKRQNISQIGPRGAKLEIFTLWWETWNLKKKFQIDPTALKIAGMPRQGVLMKNFWKGAPTTSSERRSSGKMPLLCRRTGELNARLYVAI